MTGRVRRWVRVVAVVGAWFALGGAPVAAQQAGARTGLVGRVIDAEGRAVADLAVSVHRVSQTGGEEVARSTTDADGRFELAFDTKSPGTYFVATRYEGGLYVGPMFRELDEAPDDYVLVVGRDPIAIGAGPAGATAPPPAPPTWPLLLLIGAIGAGVVIFPVVARRNGPRAVRTLLHELAILEERRAAGRIGDAEYADARAVLRERLHERIRGGR